MKKSILFLAFLITIANAVVAQETKVYQTKEGVAINGYDVVAYHQENKAVKGEENYIHNWNGAKWMFASKENLKAFEKSPEKYAPQYGGYCAYGFTKGYAAPTKPDAFAVVDGKLYLNYNLEVQKIWNKDIASFIAKADEQYKSKQKKTVN